MYDVHHSNPASPASSTSTSSASSAPPGAMSRAPRTDVGWGDEDRRQGLLLMLSSRYAPAGPRQGHSPLRVGPTCSFAWRIAISSLPNA